MNADMIDLYRGVQKYRGEWKAGDRVWHGEEGKGTIHEIMAHRTARVAFDRGTLGIGFHLDSLLWLPPVWSEDERCLIGMIGWCDISKYEEPDGQPRYTVWHRGRYFQANTLPEALLRAIRE